MREQSATFPEISDRAAIETARVWHCKYRTLEPLSRFRNLRGLDIASFPDVTLEPVASLDHLWYISILHHPNVTALSHLQALRSLQTLRLHTLPSWDSSGKQTIAHSLDPLAELAQLRHVELLGVVPADQSLSALE